jgi:sulfopyruvate decarboxylase TPP-binding subunit
MTGPQTGKATTGDRPGEHPGPAGVASSFDGPAVTTALTAAGVSHVVWVPDSALGRWDAALSSAAGLSLIRVCREGEAVGLAMGLHIGGARPLVMMQCTGFFEAGDAIRNAVHDLKVPLFFLIGVRSWYAHRAGRTTDTCPVFVEPIVRAWQIPFSTLDPQRDTPADLAAAYTAARQARRAGAVLLAE